MAARFALGLVRHKTLDGLNYALGNFYDYRDLPTAKSVPDTGSGADQVNVSSGATGKNVADAGSGADAIAGITARILVVETGSGSEALALLARLAQADAGSGSDSPGILARLTQADAGAGADVPSVLEAGSSKLVQDTGAGADQVAGILARFTIADAGSGLDAAAVLLELLGISDAGSGSEQVSRVDQGSTKQIQDTGTGLDQVAALLNRTLIVDTGAGLEAIAELVRLSLADAGAGADAAVLAVRFTAADAGSGADVPAVSQAGDSKVVVDAGTGLDALAGILARIQVQDAVVGADFVAVLAEGLIVFHLFDAPTRARILELRPKDRTVEPTSRALTKAREIFLDPGIEAWTSPTDPTYWTNGLSGTSTINREATNPHSGLYCARGDVDAANSGCSLRQNRTLTAGQAIRWAWWYRTSAGRTIYFDAYCQIGGVTHYLQADGTWKKVGDPGFVYDLGPYSSEAWARFYKEFVAPAADGAITILAQRGSMTSSSFWLDDAHLGPIFDRAGLRPRDRIVDVAPRDRDQDRRL